MSLWPNSWSNTELCSFLEIMRSNGFCLANTETIVFDHSLPEEKERPSSTDSVEHTWVFKHLLSTAVSVLCQSLSSFISYAPKLVPIMKNQACKLVAVWHKLPACFSHIFQCSSLEFALNVLNSFSVNQPQDPPPHRKCVCAPLPVRETKEEHIPHGASPKTRRYITLKPLNFCALTFSIAWSLCGFYEDN